MNAPPYNRLMIALVAGIAVAALMVMLVVPVIRQPPSPPAAGVEPPPEDLQPSLNCAFYDFMHTQVVVGFDSAVAFPNGGPPHFEERAQGRGKNPPTTFDPGQRPIWTYGHDDGTPAITSPDGATRIVLYGLKLGTGGVVFIEAGIRSNEYRNLGGQCRQVNFSNSGRGDPGSSPDDAARRENTK